ncbi:twin-arginine translocase TatA/TatE family subunit [Alicyclobacillus acidiphilus]|uniref:twin-arginine translocase TatA/TatE family subunit n=1 Tax=Alicyclobacillus acidiphilus TaxID=182455 RepID=UPI000830630D|nr:twin-arginine translocase TatA/TatE family subunit [Alicyclobacillus acidiphilus]
MVLGNIGPSGLILILVALLLVFGPRKLPEIGKGFGKGLREFRRATSGIKDDEEGASTASDWDRSTGDAVEHEGPQEASSKGKRD